MKIFSEVLSVINKCFPCIPSRKRSRLDTFSSGVTVAKMGSTQSYALSAFDFEQQKVEERGKSVIPNKRTRTSLVDQRVCISPANHISTFFYISFVRNYIIRQHGIVKVVFLYDCC